MNTKNNDEIIISSKTLKKGNYNLILRWIVNNKELEYGKTKLFIYLYRIFIGNN